ncbi:diguanylate cyclase [Vibrio metschnikovii]
MVDVDHFKAFNDTHGHETGDDVLKLVASRHAAPVPAVMDELIVMVVKNLLCF